MGSAVSMDLQKSFLGNASAVRPPRPFGGSSTSIHVSKPPAGMKEPTLALILLTLRPVAGARRFTGLLAGATLTSISESISTSLVAPEWSRV
jgi:hypothetical protein